MTADKIAKRLEEFKALKAENPTWTVKMIAEKIGVHKKTLEDNVRKWKKKGLLDDNSTPIMKESYESLKQQVGEAIKGDPQLIKKLQGRISELEQQVKGYPALQKRAAKLEIENMKLEDHYEKNLKKTAEKINDLTEKLEDAYIEKDRWEQQARSYARENDLMNGTNKDLREIAEQLRRERNASVELLKVTL